MSELDKTIYNSFEQELIDNGYKIYSDHFKHAIRIFEKKVVDKKGIKYFIHIYHYNYNKQFPEWDDSIEDRYTATSQLRLDKEGKDICIDISYSGDVLPNEYRPVTTLQEIEKFFEEFFVHFKVDYYEKFS